MDAQQLAQAGLVGKALCQAGFPLLHPQNRGGRPTKAAEGKKSRYVSQAAWQKHVLCESIAAFLSVPGHSKAKAFAREVARTGCVC